jgi:hypothetical protein
MWKLFAPESLPMPGAVVRIRCGESEYLEPVPAATVHQYVYQNGRASCLYWFQEAI